MFKKIQTLEQHIEKSKKCEEEIMEEVCKNHKEIENLETILERAKNCFKNALDVIIITITIINKLCISV